MDEVKLYYDPIGNTLTVWFGDPKKEYICEETGEEVVLMKDKKGQVIGLEKLNYHGPMNKHLNVSLETLSHQNLKGAHHANHRSRA
jgi:uncharacterized protein YuzE